MPTTLTVFQRSPDQGRGLARDMRVRWALEEVGRPYQTLGVTFAELKSPEHRARNPFGQIPTYGDGEVRLFESGAVVLHIAERHGGLLPSGPAARARAIAWMFAAVSTVEPPVVELSMAALFERDKPWFADRHPMLQDRVRTRLAELTHVLGDRDWLDGDFSAGDLMMVTVLRRLGSSGLLDEYPTVAAYIARAEARPAYQRAFAAQKAAFEAAGAAE